MGCRVYEDRGGLARGYLPAVNCLLDLAEQSASLVKTEHNVQSNSEHIDNGHSRQGQVKSDAIQDGPTNRKQNGRSRQGDERPSLEGQQHANYSRTASGFEATHRIDRLPLRARQLGPELLSRHLAAKSPGSAEE